MDSSLSDIARLNDTNGRRMSAAMAIEAYICSALMQPPFLFPIENFEEYQEEFKATAIVWSNRTSRAVYRLNSKIISFCDMYNAFYPRLALYASQFTDTVKDKNEKDKTKNDKARNSFRPLWESLLEEVKSSKATSEASLHELSLFIKRLETDRNNFLEICDAPKQSKDDKDHLYRYWDLIDEKKTAMGNAMIIIASGAMLGDLGLLIKVSSLGAIEWGGHKFPVVGSGLKVAKKGSSEEVSQAAKDFNKTSKGCAEYISKSRAISDCYTGLHHVITDINSILVHTDYALRVTEIMHNLFTSLESGFERILQFLDVRFASEKILETVNNGKKDCESVSKAANAIQNTLLHLEIDTSRLRSGDYPKA